MRAFPLCALLGACALDDTPLPGAVVVVHDGGNGDGGGADGGGDDGGGVDAGRDAATGCVVDVAAPDEVTLGTRVVAASGLSCGQDAATHTCLWRADWNDDGDEVDEVVGEAHPCVEGETFTFAAAAVSDDASSFYRVSLALDGAVPGGGRASVFVGGFQIVATTKAGLTKVSDIAVDVDAHRAWIASDEGLAAMLGFDGPGAAVLTSGASDCGDALDRCPQHTVAVAGGFAWAGSGADLAEIVRAELDGRDLVAEAIGIGTKGRVRSIVASRVADGRDEDPGLYVTQDERTFVVANEDLDANDLTIDQELATDGDDLAAIVATDVEPGDGDDQEALWRLESGGHGELQRLEVIGGAPPAVAAEEVLDKNASSIALFQGLVAMGQNDGRVFAVDLEALDPDAATPLVDATAVLELPVADDPARLDTIDDVLDLFVGEDGLTLWAVSPDTFVRVTGGTLFASSISDLPPAMRAIAVLTDAGGAEVILIGTEAGLYISRADMHD